MEIFEPLPNQLHSSFHSIVPSGVIQRLSYLWKACNKMSLSSSLLSHRLSVTFIDLCKSYGIILPLFIQSRFCDWCFALQLPSYTCSTKIKSRKKLNKIGNSRVVKDKLFKNFIINKCTVCNKQARAIGACKKIAKVEAKVNPTIADDNKLKAKKFSFLDETNPKRLSAPSRLEGDFIPLGNCVNMHKTPTKDFKVSSTLSQTSEKISVKRENSNVNLLELERSNKKARKQSVKNCNNTSVAVVSKTTNCGQKTESSLKSLQSLFAIK